jgi:hypothetical protein
MLNVHNNPLLGQVHTEAGAKHRIDRLIYAEIEQYRHTTTRTFVEGRLRALGVNTVGSHEKLLAYWTKTSKAKLDVLMPKSVAAQLKRAKKKATAVLAPLPAMPVLSF